MVTLAANVTKDIGIGEAALDALLGYAVVFVGLVLLMVVIMLVGKLMSSGSKKAVPAPAPAAAAPVAAAPAPEAKKDLPKAPGSAGELKLYDTSDKDAAIIMAIVADKMGKPLNELRFISIKEVK